MSRREGHGRGGVGAALLDQDRLRGADGRHVAAAVDLPAGVGLEPHRGPAGAVPHVDLVGIRAIALVAALTERGGGRRPPLRERVGDKREAGVQRNRSRGRLGHADLVDGGGGARVIVHGGAGIGRHLSGRRIGVSGSAVELDGRGAVNTENVGERVGRAVDRGDGDADEVVAGGDGDGDHRVGDGLDVGRLRGRAEGDDAGGESGG